MDEITLLPFCLEDTSALDAPPVLLPYQRRWVANLSTGDRERAVYRYYMG